MTIYLTHLLYIFIFICVVLVAVVIVFALLRAVKLKFPRLFKPLLITLSLIFITILTLVLMLILMLIRPVIYPRYLISSLDHPSNVEVVGKTNNRGGGGGGTCDNFFYSTTYKYHVDQDEIEQFYKAQFLEKGYVYKESVNAYKSKDLKSGFQIEIGESTYTITAGSGDCPWPIGG